MKRIAMALMIGAVTMASVLAHGSNQESRPEQSVPSERSVIGAWKGMLEDRLPITLTFKMEGGKLLGAVSFDAVREDGTVEGRSPELALIDLKFDGKTATFKIEKMASEGELGFKLIGANEAELKLKGTQFENGYAIVKMFRGK